jgi:hypothetical protein
MKFSKCPGREKSPSSNSEKEQYSRFVAITGGLMSGEGAQGARLLTMTTLAEIIASAVPRREALCENCKQEMLMPLSWRDVCLPCMREESQEAQKAAVAKAEKEHK